MKRPRIVARLIDLRAGESRMAILSFLVLMLTSAGYTVLETARDAPSSPAFRSVTSASCTSPSPRVLCRRRPSWRASRVAGTLAPSS